MPDKKKKKSALAMTILLGIFVAAMLTIFVNLLVTYVYEEPNYDKYCPAISGTYPIKYGIDTQSCQNCTFSKTIQEQTDACLQQRGQPIYEYNSRGCTSSVKECNMCSKQFDADSKKYNRITFFIYAIIGFVLIIFGLFTPLLLLQIVTLPAGAFLVIEAATKNFDDKLFVIITFGLLIAAALYLALKKLKLK